MYERHESEVSKGGNWETSHVGDGDIIILEIFQGGTRMRRGTGVRVVVANDGAFRNRPARMRGRSSNKALGQSHRLIIYF